MSGEIIAARLNTIHNLHFYLELMRKAREAISEGRWESFRNFCVTRFVNKDPAN